MPFGSRNLTDLMVHTIHQTLNQIFVYSTLLRGRANMWQACCRTFLVYKPPKLQRTTLNPRFFLGKYNILKTMRFKLKNTSKCVQETYVAQI